MNSPHIDYTKGWGINLKNFQRLGISIGDIYISEAKAKYYAVGET